MTALADIITYFLLPIIVAMTFVLIELLCILFILDKLIVTRKPIPDFLIRFTDAYVNVMLVLVFLMVQAAVLYGVVYVISIV